MASAEVDGLGAGAARRLEDPLAAQVALCRRCGPDRHRVVGEAYVERIAVCFGVHGNGGDTETAGGGHDAAGDLATVGNQDAVEHQESAPLAVGAALAQTGARF